MLDTIDCSEDTKKKILGSAVTVPPSLTNVYTKTFRFASDDGNLGPWIKYTAYTYGMMAPLGLLGFSNAGCGWISSGVSYGNGVSYYGNHLGVSLDAIPMGNPYDASAGFPCRIGPAIKVHRIYGKWIVQTRPFNPTGVSGNASKVYRVPVAHTYIRRTPISDTSYTAVAGNAYNQGQTAIGFCQYPGTFLPATGTGFLDPAFADFVSFGSGTGAGTPNPPTPYMPADQKSWVVDELCTVRGDLLHRLPNMRTEVIDYKKTKTVNEIQLAVGLASGSSNVNTGYVTTAEALPYQQAHDFHIPVQHHFKHGGLKIVYSDLGETAGTSGLSVADVNQLRAIFWQNTTGCLFVDSAANTASSTWQAGYIQQIGYEFFVDFTDCQM